MVVPAEILSREREFAAAFRRAALDGVRLDRDQVEKLIAEHEESRAAAKARVTERTNGAITNPKSAPQVGPYLVQAGYELPRSEKTGAPSAGKGALEPLAHLGDELAKDILQYRKDDTALGLLLEPRRLLCERGDGRVRTTILTLAANTGRTSSRSENLQQVSRQGGMRACHLAGEGCLIVSADFSSVEVRVGAALSGDKAMQELIRLGDLYPDRKKEFDFHWRTAVTCYGPDATEENRYVSKRVNFARMFGAGKKSAAALVGIPFPEVSAAFDAFDAVASGYSAWDQEMRQFVRKGGASYPTYSGRPVWLTGKGEHAAGNAAIQGTAREFLVDAVLEWRKGPWKGCTAVPVHDELIVFDVPEAEAADATAYLVQCMSRDFMGVAITAKANKPSRAWADASLRGQLRAVGRVLPGFVRGIVPEVALAAPVVPPVVVPPLPVLAGTCLRHRFPSFRYRRYPVYMTDFSEALLHVKAGGSAYRAGWRENGYQGVLKLVAGERYRFEFLYMESPVQSERGAFAGAHADLLADDWVISNT